jgi:Nuclease subunit of the excinuclease complex
VLAAFLAQFYANKPPPPLILVNELPAEADLLTEALSIKAERKVEILQPVRGARRNLIDNALANAREALARRMAENASQRHLLEGVQQALSLEQVPQRIEVYDNSHLQGRSPYGAMIVAGPEGFMKGAYRKFSIAGDVAPGDDYAMMREMLTRRFARVQKEDPDRERGQWPDLVLIDGGAGQLSTAQGVLDDLGIDDVALCAIAKGRTAMPGASASSCRGASLSASSPAIPCSITCSACATRPIASPSGPIGPGAPPISTARPWTRSPASGASASALCCSISARPRGWRRRG